MTHDFHDTELVYADFRDARLRGCDLTGARITGGEVDDLRISAHAGELGSVTIEGVEVSGYVHAELDRRFPERVRLRELATIEDYRAAWTLLESLWDGTIARAATLPEELRQQRVDDEYSFVETVRHLVFAVDVWINNMLREQPDYHRLGMANGGGAREGAAELGVELDATPTFAEALEAHAGRRAMMRAALAEVTDAQLADERTRATTPWWPVQTETVGQCLRVVLDEHCDHRRYAERDLDVLAGPAERP